MYYLQSRYYDPAVGRFINADGYVSTGQGLIGNNMYAYCNNNPVMYVDPTGELFEFIKDAWSWITGKYETWVKETDKTLEGAGKIEYSSDGQMVKFNYEDIHDYNIWTSSYYADEISKKGLPTGRSTQGIFYELLGHYFVYKIDIFELTHRDNIAEMGSPQKDSNAWIWEDLIPGIISGLEAWYYDYY